MRVFISWSKAYSREIAELFAPWLRRVLHSATPFVSTGIEAGARWQTEINSRLNDTDFGLVCVTAENQGEPWLNFEAGALAKKLDQARVIPLCIDLTPGELRQPLAQFQAKSLIRPDVEEVILSINSASAAPLDEALVRDSVEQWWPRISRQIAGIHRRHAGDVRPSRAPSTEDMLTEILSVVRQFGPQPEPVEVLSEPDEASQIRKFLLYEATGYPSISITGVAVDLESRQVVIRLHDVPHPRAIGDLAKDVLDRFRVTLDWTGDREERKRDS